MRPCSAGGQILLTGETGFRDGLIDWFQRSARENHQLPGHHLRLQKWEKFSADGTISSEIAITVLGRGIEPALGKNPMRQLHPGFPDMDSFWGQAFTIAIRGEDPVQETERPDIPDASARQDPQADGLAYAASATALRRRPARRRSVTRAAPEVPTGLDTRDDALGAPPLPPQAIPEYGADADALSGLPTDR